MKTIYFNLSNGEVVKPSILPAYKAVLKGGKVVEIQTCFSIVNVIRNGQEWTGEQIDEERKAWETLPHLMKSLNRYARAWLFLHPFKDTNFQETHYHRFFFLPFWKL